jgi:hypothetical protein
MIEAVPGLHYDSGETRAAEDRQSGNHHSHVMREDRSCGRHGHHRSCDPDHPDHPGTTAMPPTD